MTRLGLALSAVVVTVAAVVEVARAADGRGPSLVPRGSVAAVRGAEVAARFELSSRFELRLQVNNAFAAQNRAAVARAEARIAAIPGVRKVAGPAGLLAAVVDAGGRVSAGPLLAGSDDEEANEAVRQRLVRRSDAIGWFLARDGTEIRLLVDTDDLPAVQAKIEAAVVSSGLVLLSGGVEGAPLWPDPLRPPLPFPRWLPLALAAATALLFVLAVAARGRATGPRTALALAATTVAAAAPGLFAPVDELGRQALGLGAGVALLLALGLLVARLAGQRAPARALVPFGLVAVALPLVVAGVALGRRVEVATQLWRRAPVFFVSVRGDLDEPVVLRELRRLTDFLRAQPGVAHAWSIADLFSAVPVAAEEVAGIPDTRERTRAVLARVADDAAVRLELGADHREALIGVRLDAQAGVDRLEVVERLERYLATDHRPALVRVDVRDGRLPPATRLLGRGLLAADARERVLRICARSGRNLDEAGMAAVDRFTRQAASLPAADARKLKLEIAGETTRFLEEVTLASRQVALPHAGERQRLIDELGAESTDASPGDTLRALAGIWRPRVPLPVLEARAAELHGRLGAVRRRHAARNNFRDMLYGAELPTEGVLSEEVRDATREAMGPVVGLPLGTAARRAGAALAPAVPGAFVVDAAAVGGAPSDRALSLAWRQRLGWGLLLAAAFVALVLAVAGGLPALGWWPVAFAPAASLLVLPALAGAPIGTAFMAALAGALGGGAGFAVTFAPGRRDT